MSGVPAGSTIVGSGAGPVRPREVSGATIRCPSSPRRGRRGEHDGRPAVRGGRPGGRGHDTARRRCRRRRLRRSVPSTRPRRRRAHSGRPHPVPAPRHRRSWRAGHRGHPLPDRLDEQGVHLRRGDAARRRRTGPARPAGRRAAARARPRRPPLGPDDPAVPALPHLGTVERALRRVRAAGRRLDGRGRLRPPGCGAGRRAGHPVRVLQHQLRPGRPRRRASDRPGRRHPPRRAGPRPAGHDLDDLDGAVRPAAVRPCTRAHRGVRGAGGGARAPGPVRRERRRRLHRGRHGDLGTVPDR